MTTRARIFTVVAMIAVAIVPLGGVAVSAYVLIQRLRRKRAASARTDEHHASPEEGGAVQQALEKSAPN